MHILPAIWPLCRPQNLLLFTLYCSIKLVMAAHDDNNMFTLYSVHVEKEKNEKICRRRQQCVSSIFFHLKFFPLTLLWLRALNLTHSTLISDDYYIQPATLLSSWHHHTGFWACQIVALLFWQSRRSFWTAVTVCRVWLTGRQASSQKNK